MITGILTAVIIAAVALSVPGTLPVKNKKDGKTLTTNFMLGTKSIIDDNGNVGRYIDEDETTYHGDIQDDYRIDKSIAHTDVVKACEGQGILTLKVPGRQPAFSLPDANADTVGIMIHEEGYIPETYRCLGYIKGWFPIEVDGKAGFIREDLVSRDAINTF